MANVNQVCFKLHLWEKLDAFDLNTHIIYQPLSFFLKFQYRYDLSLVSPHINRIFQQT
jgi:hypothetical protein